MYIVYPAVFHKEDEGYWVEFPDLEGCHSMGDTLSETLENADEALEGYCLTLLESGQKLPEPSNIEDICADENSFINLIDCKLTKAPHRSVKKTLTIPYWLNEMACNKGINFSQTLQDALMKQLNV